jgi:hypothetical protein
LWRWMISMKTVGRSWSGFVKIWTQQEQTVLE